MSNFELVFPYSENDAAWLAEQGCPCPEARAGNRMPTTADMKWALQAKEEFAFDDADGDGELYGKDGSGQEFVVSGFDWDDATSIPGEHFLVRGSLALLPALIRLSERCGQLYLYPDSGAPPIVIEPGLDAEEIADLYREACEELDPLAYFFEQMYGRDGLAAG